MKRIILFLYLVCNISQASNWVRLPQGEEFFVYVDSASISQIGKLRKAWFSYSYYKDQKPNTYTFNKKYQSIKTLIYFSCIENTFSTVQTLYYSKIFSGGIFLGGEIHQISSFSAFNEVAPDTFNEIMEKYVCSTLIPVEK